MKARLTSSVLIGMTAVACFTGCGGTKASLEVLKKDMGDVRSLQAQHTEAISQIRTEMRALQGKIEEIQYSALGKTEELERTLRTIGTRVPPPEGVPEDLLNQDEDGIGRIGGGPAAEQFSEALRALRIGDFKNCKSLFRTFVDANPGTAFTDNALFWIGICHDKLGEYDQSIVSYSEVFQQYPAEDRVAPSLFFLGEAFARMGSNEDAVITLQKLVDDHPRSTFAAKAKQRIRELSQKKRQKRR